MAFLKSILSRFSQKNESQRAYAKAIKQITGERPYNIRLYELAMKHTSVAEENNQGFKESNERLEYLGDAILGAVVAEYLFKRYPYKPEGFLTEIRSRIVNREALNLLAINIGLNHFVEYEGKKRTGHSHKSIFGDAIEAFIGAVYLDKGFHFCRKFIVRKIIMQHLDIDQVVENKLNFKSLIIEWSQKHNKQVTFEAVGALGESHSRQFRIKMLVDGDMVSEGWGFSKKKAEQDAARKGAEFLGLG